MPAVAKERTHCKPAVDRPYDEAMKGLRAAQEAMQAAQEAFVAQERALANATHVLMEALQHATTGTALYIAGPSSKIYLGDKAIRKYTDDAAGFYTVLELLGPTELQLTTVAVQGNTFTILGLLPNVAQLLFAYGEQHTDEKIDLNVSLKRKDGPVLRWDDKIEAGMEYTTQQCAVPYERTNCFEYTNKDGIFCAQEPCFQCPNPLCKCVNIFSMFDKRNPNDSLEYRPSSPVFTFDL